MALLATVVAIGVVLRPYLFPDSTVTADSAAAASSSTAGPTSVIASTASTGSADPVAVSPSAPSSIAPEPPQVASDPPLATSAGRAQVTLTYAAYQPSSRTVRANGFASGVIEDGGVCTLTVTRGSSVITATSTSLADATTTSCGLLETAPGVPAGTWRAVLTYSSATVRGTSEALTVVVG